MEQALTQHPDLLTQLQALQDPELLPIVQPFISDWQMNRLDGEFEALVTSSTPLNTEHAAVLLARLAYPTITTDSVGAILDRLAEDARPRLGAAPSTAQQGALLAHYLFQDLGFRGNESNYYDPDNSYVNRVLERRTGIPISLSCIYLWVGQRLGLPVFGVGLPGHFIAGCKSPERSLFFDCFAGGRLLTATDCVRIVHRSGVEFHDRFLQPMPPQQIVSRQIVNLINLYTERNQPDLIQRLNRWGSLLQEAG